VLEKLVTKIRVASFGQFWYPPAVHAPQTLGFVLDWNVHNIDEDHPIGLNRDPSLKTFAGVWAIVVILPKMQQLLIWQRHDLPDPGGTFTLTPPAD
jgi:hypothetical protein